MSIIEPIIAKYGSTFFASLVTDAITFTGEYIYDQEDGIYATILAQALKNKEINEISLINEMITYVEVLPDWDLKRYDELLAEKTAEIDLTPASIDEIVSTKVYTKKPLQNIDTAKE